MGTLFNICRNVIVNNMVFYTCKYYKNKMKFKEYKGTKKGYDNYKEPIQKFVNQQVKIRMYCAEDGCYTYIKGILGCNGAFTAETGQMADLRNQIWECNKHRKEE